MAPTGPRNDCDHPRYRNPRTISSSVAGAAIENAITKSHSAPSAWADFKTSTMKPGATSRPIARDTTSQPTTSTASATMPLARLLHEVRRSARYSANRVPDSRVASQSTANTAGRPIITDSESTVPLPATVLIEARSKGGPLRTRKHATSANCPANIAAKISAPHNAVPQSFQTFCEGASGNGTAGAGLSSELINDLLASSCPGL